MEPAPLGAVHWSELGSMLFALWMVVIFIVLFAANMLVGHNLLPSFIASRHVPEVTSEGKIAVLCICDRVLRDCDVFPLQHDCAGRCPEQFLGGLLDIEERRRPGA